ncbi:MAG: sulfatase-like hydrolase/transferase [Bacteroidota bacterium]
MKTASGKGNTAWLATRSMLQQAAFWLLLFAVFRAVFLVYHIPLLSGIPFGNIAASFWFALPLDLSACSYILLLPFLICVIQTFYSPRWLNYITITYTIIIILIFSGITTAELGVFEEWRTKLHYKALLYLLHPAEIMDTAPTGTFILLGLIFLAQAALFIFIFLKWAFIRITGAKRRIFFTFGFFVCASALLFLGVRGGTRQIPINQSESYFSKYEILNLAAVNSGWNLAHSIANNYGIMEKNPYVFYNRNDAENIVKKMYSVPCDSTKMILNTARPNIVMFILEGWSADLIESLGGEKGITPWFHEMEHEGILFTDIYSSGTRSQQGMSAIFGGFPATPLTTITQSPEKYSKLPSFSKDLKTAGYTTSYTFGGQLIYGNIKSYIMDNGFDRVVEDADFDASIPRGKLGIHDEFTFPLFAKDLEQEQQPFFSAIFTISTHSPYDMNMDEPLQWPVLEKKYVNAALYDDRCIHTFMESVKQKPWYANTLFVFVSDHGHSSYKNREFTTPAYHKIVFMLYGEAIKKEFRGTKVTQTGSQVDVAATLLPQLGMSAEKFVWSKNLLNPCTPGFAFYAFEEGLGWVRPGGYYVYDARTKSDHEIVTASPLISKDTLVKEGKSYLQCVFQEYMEK